MSHRLTRRSFVKSIGYGGAALPLISPGLVRAVSPNSKIRHASFGANGMAWVDISSLARHPKFELVLACDVDSNRFDKVKDKFPKAQLVADWREVFDKHADKFDSCNVTTPDHMHAPIAMAAVHHGKHVYCQKPLTHEIYESRQLANAARKAGVTTQMGIQVHSSTAYRLAVKLLHDGAIGKIKQAHVWSNKTWGGNATRPDKTDPVPANLDWNKWLGVAPERPYVNGAYHPGQWRRWLDFGTGTLGDMGCHIFSPVFAGLGLTAPTSVRSEGDSPGVEQWAIRGLIHYTFPATPYTVDAPIPVTWYDGGMEIPSSVAALLGDYKVPGQGSIIIGEKGVMLLPHVGGPRLFPQEQYKDYNYPKLPGDDHWSQFIDVCLGERDHTLAGWDFAGPLTETVLMGNIAARYKGEELKWNSEALKFTNNSEANNYVRREYRKGWEVPGLS